MPPCLTKLKTTLRLNKKEYKAFTICGLAVLAMVISMALMPVFTFSQNQNTKQLRERLNKVSGAEKVEVYNELAKIVRNDDRKLSLEFATDARMLAEKLNDQKGLSLALKNIGNAYFFQAEYDSAQRYYKLALPIFRTTGDLIGVSACLNNLGVIYSETGRYDEAINYLHQSVEVDSKLGDKVGASNTINNIASIYKYQGKYGIAIKLLNEYILFDRQLNNNSGLMDKLNALGVIYVAMAEPEKALKYYNEALQIAKADSNNYLRAILLANIGNAYIVMEKFNDALPFLNEALMLSEDIDDQENIANTLTNLAEINRIKGNYFKANEQLMQVLRINESVDDKRTVAATLTCIGDNLLNQKEFDKAIGYYNQSLLIADSIGATTEILDNYSRLVKAHSAISSFAKADSFQKLYSELYFQFKSDSDTSKLNHNLQPRNPQETAVIASQRRTGKWIFAFVMMLLILVIATVGFRQYKK
jgi:tetratricopeptide (TPR) repeat protein